MEPRLNIVIAPDIYGVAPLKKMVTNQIAESLHSCEVVDPYSGKKPCFQIESELYQHFIDTCGHDGYLQKVQHKLADIEGPIVLVGFSAGASAIWRAIGSERYPNVVGCIGFYPGQIRNHLDVTPSCPTKLVFPIEEKHFDIEPVIETLLDRSNVTIEKTKYQHGFMNPKSQGYNEKAAVYYSNWLTGQIQTAAKQIEAPITDKF